MKHINYLSLILSTIFLVSEAFNYYFINDNYSPEESIVISDNYNDITNIYINFKNNNFKIKNNEILTLNLSATLKEIDFISSNENKIKIINKTNNSCQIKKISNFHDIIDINLSYQNKILDTCYVTCFNEILNIKDICLYKYYENHNNNFEYQKITQCNNGYYIIDFHLEKYMDFLPFENETISIIDDFIKNNLSTDFIKLNYSPFGNIAYKFYLDTQKVFSNSLHKTFIFNIDELYYNLYLELGK